MSYRGPNHLETCSFKFCNVLVYRNEAVQGKDIPGRSRGWFCKHCAHVLGYRTREQLMQQRRDAAAAAAYGDSMALDRFIAQREATTDPE